jgi:hypothetical protein
MLRVTKAVANFFVIVFQKTDRCTYHAVLFRRFVEAKIVSVVATINSRDSMVQYCPN